MSRFEVVISMCLKAEKPQTEIYRLWLLLQQTDLTACFAVVVYSLLGAPLQSQLCFNNDTKK
jgi:hypothetical protein